jgi:hypothetical protein
VVSNREELAWKGVSYAAGAGAMLLSRRVLTAAWRWRRSTPPPDGPAANEAPLGDALTWAIAAGIGVAVARVVAIRSAARAWEAVTDEPPPVVAA